MIVCNFYKNNYTLTNNNVIVGRNMIALKQKSSIDNHPHDRFIGGNTLSKYKRYTEYYVFILMCIVPLFFLPASHLDPFGLPKILLWTVSLSATLMLILFEKVKSKNPIVRITNSKIIWLMALYALIWIISTIFSVDWFISLTGIPLLNGLLQLLMSIVTFILVYSYYKFSEKHMIYILIVYCVVSIYCLLQFYNWDPFVNYYGEALLIFKGQTFSTIGNQNNVSTCLSVIYIVTAFFFIVGNPKFTKDIMYVIGSILIFSGVVATQTRGGWLAVAVAFAAALPLVINNKVFLGRYITMIISSVVIFLIIDMTSGGTIIVNRILPMLFEAWQISKGHISSDFGSSRVEIWMNSIELVKKYWLIGSGPDTFTTVYGNLGFYPKDSTGKDQVVFLTAHNQSLQLLITTGIFSLITYWLIVGNIMKMGYKKVKSDCKIIPFLLGLVCYITKGMFNCSAVTDMTIFWVLLAVVYSASKEDHPLSGPIISPTKSF